MKYFPWFDSLRFMAVGLVLFAHAPDIAASLPGASSSLFHVLNRMGWSGVDLFYVLSGFLVSGLLFIEHDRTGHIDCKRFLIRRAFKIVPSFYVLIVVAILVDLYLGRTPWHKLLEKGFREMFFLQSYRHSLFPHSWSLAVEMHFYLLVTWLVYWMTTRKGAAEKGLRQLPAILLGVLVACLAMRLINCGLQPERFNFMRMMGRSHLRLDSLAAGVLLRYAYMYRRDLFSVFTRHRLGWLAVAGVLWWPSYYIFEKHAWWLTALVPTFNYLAFGIVLAVAVMLPAPAAGWGRALLVVPDYLGKHSYSIYLWHIGVKDWMVSPLGLLPVAMVGAYMAGSLVVGSAMSSLLEMPTLLVRDRLFPSQTKRAQGKSAAVSA